jgi:tetratricopeptide (TPR) repeat protein
LLSRAAVAGRELDQQLLTQLSNDNDVETFITAGANTAIFDVVDGVWRFAHDKLRQAVINEIPADELASLHYNVAQALEATYPDDKRYAEALARHWDAANMPEKALPYIITAGEEITNIVGDYERAEAMIRRGLTLAEDLPDKDRFWSQLYLLLGNVEKRRAELGIATTHFEKSLELAGDDATLQVPTLCNLAEIAYRTGRLDDMQQLAEHTLRLARASGEIHGEAVSLRCLGKLAVDNGDVETGFNYYEQSIALLQPTEYRIQSAAIYNDMGIACAKQGDNKRAAIYFEQALVIHRKEGNRAGIANLLTNLGMLANLNQDYDAAHKYFSESAETSRAIGYQLGMAITLGHLGMIANAQENYTHAVDYFHQSMTICRESHMMPEVAIHLANQAFAYISLGQYDAARANLTESLNLSQELSSVPLQLTALMLVAHLYYDTNNLTAARQLVQFIRHQEKTTAEYRALYFDPLIEKLSIAQHTIADDSKSLPDIVTEVQAYLQQDAGTLHNNKQSPHEDADSTL